MNNLHGAARRRDADEGAGATHARKLKFHRSAASARAACRASDLLLLPLLPLLPLLLLLLLLLPSLLLHIASVLCWLGRAHLAHSGQQHTLSLFSGAAERRA
jgi:hypothetical protein